MSALCSIGPRQTTAASSSTKKPIDITFMPWASSGMILRSAETGGRVGAEAEHARDRVAPDVGVEHADALALGASAPRRGSRSASTCRRRPCPSRCRPRWRPARARPRAGSPRPSFCCSAAFCASLEHVEVDVHVRDALERRDGLARRRSGSARVIGQPGGRQRDGHVDDAVGARASIERTMSSSTIERCSSGSITTSSALRISSSVGHARPLWQTDGRGPGAPIKRPADGGGRPRVEGGEGATSAGGI